MKRIVFTWMSIGFICISLSLKAQDPSVQALKKEASRSIAKNPKDTSSKAWKTGGLFNLTFGQTSLSNWAAGGDQFSLNVNGLVNLHAFYKKDRHAWDNSLDLAMGYVNSTSLGTRKIDDRIDFLSKYGYELAPKWYASGLFNFRTQFADGFNYPSATEKVFTSTFLAPAYALVSLGIDFKPNDAFSLFVSPITSRWVIVRNDSLSSIGAYGVDSGKTSRNELGAYLTANYMKEIIKNLTYKAKLDLFSNYKDKPQNVDLFMTNLLSMNVFKGISFSVGLDMIYDDNVRIFGPNSDAPRLQVREYIGIGYQAKF